MTSRLRSLSSFRDFGIVWVLILMVLVVAVSSDTFLTPRNLSNLSGQWAAAGVMAAAATIVLISGGFDLSIAATYSLSAVTAAAVAPESGTVLAYLAALGVGVLVGLVNALLIAGLDVNPFIATLGMSFIIGGVALLATDNKPYYVDDESFTALGTWRFAGIPLTGVLLILTLIATGFLLHRTVYGHQIYAVGGNPHASRLAGIPVKRVVGMAYLLSGLCAAVAGIISASNLGAAQANPELGMLFDVITIVIVGGTSLSGGFGAMWRTVVGIGILATLANGFNLLGVSTYFQDIVKGTVIIGALALDAHGRKASE